MTEILKDRKDMDPKYEWDLTKMYANDEAFEKDLESLKEVIGEARKYEGTLRDADAVAAFCTWEVNAGRKMNDVYSYAFLRHSEDTRDSKATSMYTRAYARYVDFMSAVAFAEPEILANDEAVLDALIEDPKTAEFNVLLCNLRRQKAHMLSASEEKLLSSFRGALNAASETAESLRDADMTYASVKDQDGNEHEVSSASYIPLQMSADRVLRENAFRSLYAGYKNNVHTFASAYAGCVRGFVTEAKVRHYNSSREMSMAVDNIPVYVYDNLIQAVHDNLDKMYRYVRLRKKLLALDELHYYDVYAPLCADSKKSYTYEQAQEMVLSAVAPLGEDYVNRVKDAYEQRWIDVYPNKGKTSGAYSAGTYDSVPYILHNFTGSLESVSTLAHEMGHSQHTWLSNHTQPAQYAGYTMFVAEVASTVNENLLIEQLLKDCTDPKERMALLNQYLEGFKGTVYRQTMFAEFEMKAHARMEAGESLDCESLSAMYEDLVKLYFGEDFVMDEEVKYEWARIPHFYNPFYVYVYATGYTSAVALSEGILKEGEPAVKKYLEFLSMGSSKSPLEELKHGGVDLSTPEPIVKALEKFNEVLEDAERTAELLLK